MKPPLDVVAKAKKLPPPTPGLKLPPMPLDVLCAYVTLHGLEVERVEGGMVIVRKRKSDSLVEIAQKLSKIGD